jgi:mono/diheme cytochrome c family protein
MKRVALVVLVVAAGYLAALRPASATVEMQKAAKAAGLEVKNCQYCHGEALPKKGASTLNDRGKWLQSEKEKRKAEKIDVSWLKDYTEKK